MQPPAAVEETNYHSSFIQQPNLHLPHLTSANEHVNPTELLTNWIQYFTAANEQKNTHEQYPLYTYSQPNRPLLFSTTPFSTPLHQSLERVVRDAQDVICQHICNIEALVVSKDSTSSNPIRFREDSTLRKDGSGGGLARILSDGKVFEKAGVNISVATASVSFPRLKSMCDDHEQINQLFVNPRLASDNTSPLYNESTIVKRFTASLSLVIHPVSPFVPTTHANYRYFEFRFPTTNPTTGEVEYNDDSTTIWWTAGGADLTPTYVDDADAIHFHSVLRDLCDGFDTNAYKQWKKWCDDYFYVIHRKETRGIGGIIFDDLSTASIVASDQSSSTSTPLTRTSSLGRTCLATTHTKEQFLSFMRKCFESFSVAYFPIVCRHLFESYDEQNVRFQRLRRGRYVEFNLMYDKGTSFGLAQPYARPDAILMSLPLNVRFEYKYVPQTKEEEYTQEILQHPKEWLC